MVWTIPPEGSEREHWLTTQSLAVRSAYDLWQRRDYKLQEIKYSRKILIQAYRDLDRDLECLIGITFFWLNKSKYERRQAWSQLLKLVRK
jgi:hypothetical protein